MIIACLQENKTNLSRKLFSAKHDKVLFSAFVRYLSAYLTIWPQRLFLYAIDVRKHTLLGKSGIFGCIQKYLAHSLMIHIINIAIMGGMYYLGGINATRINNISNLRTIT